MRIEPYKCVNVASQQIDCQANDFRNKKQYDIDRKTKKSWFARNFDFFSEFSYILPDVCDIRCCTVDSNSSINSLMCFEQKIIHK